MCGLGGGWRSGVGKVVQVASNNPVCASCEPIAGQGSWRGERWWEGGSSCTCIKNTNDWVNHAGPRVGSGPHYIAEQVIATGLSYWTPCPSLNHPRCNLSCFFFVVVVFVCCYKSWLNFWQKSQQIRYTWLIPDGTVIARGKSGTYEQHMMERSSHRKSGTREQYLMERSSHRKSGTCEQYLMEPSSQGKVRYIWIILDGTVIAREFPVHMNNTWWKGHRKGKPEHLKTAIDCYSMERTSGLSPRKDSNCWILPVILKIFPTPQHMQQLFKSQRHR